MCKPLRRIHSRFPISTEYTWEADGPSCREKRKMRDLQKGDMPETLCPRTTVSGCTSYWNTLQRFSFVWVFDWEWPHPRHFIWGLIEWNEAFLKCCCRGQTQTHSHYLLTASENFSPSRLIAEPVYTQNCVMNLMEVFAHICLCEFALFSWISAACTFPKCHTPLFSQLTTSFKYKGYFW